MLFFIPVFVSIFVSLFLPIFVVIFKSRFFLQKLNKLKMHHQFCTKRMRQNFCWTRDLGVKTKNLRPRINIRPSFRPRQKDQTSLGHLTSKTILTSPKFFHLRSFPSTFQGLRVSERKKPFNTQ